MFAEYVAQPARRRFLCKKDLFRDLENAFDRIRDAAAPSQRRKCAAAPEMPAPDTCCPIVRYGEKVEETTPGLRTEIRRSRRRFGRLYTSSMRTMLGKLCVCESWATTVPNTIDHRTQRTGGAKQR